MDHALYRVRGSQSLATTLRPLAAAISMIVASFAHAVTTIESGVTEQTLSTDTAYVLPAANTVSTSTGNAIVIEGIAPAQVTSAGTVISSIDSVAAGYRFEVTGSLNESAGGRVLGTTYGVFFNGGGAGNDLVNQGDISARVSHAVAYGGTSSGTIDNFGTLNGAKAGPIGGSPNGVFMQSTGNLTINNHAGASIVSGIGDPSFGSGVVIEQGTVTLNNDGAISGFHHGVQNTTGLTLNVTNSAGGSIQGTQGAGVSIGSATANIGNAGSISGGQAGIDASAAPAATITNSAGGSIRGTADAGVRLGSGGVLVNDGLIASTEAPAIILNGANNSVTLGTGSNLAGANGIALFSQGTGNTATLTGTGSEGGNFVAISGDGLAKLSVASGSVWTLTGAVTMGGASAAALDVGGNLTLGGTLSQLGGGGSTVAAGGQLTLGTGGIDGWVTGNIVNDGTLRFNHSGLTYFTGTLSGAGSLLQIGNGATVLSGTGSSQGAVAVNAGTLALAQPGAFNAGSYATNAGGTTSIAAGSSLAVGASFTQTPGATLTVGIGGIQPIITASTATLGGALDVSGFGAAAPSTASALTGTQFNIIRTTGGISGDFARVGFGGTSSPVDYLTLAGAKSADNLNYNIGFGLTWLAGPANGNGSFTLGNASDVFNVDVPLADQSGPFASGWDGRTLTKNGAGLLILSSVDGYTGATAINGGVLRTDIANALASSSNVSVASGASLDLNGFAQRIDNLSGAGAVTLGNAALTAVNTADTVFGGVIQGSGSVIKNGAGALTLSGANTYAGGTSIEAGRIVATNGQALGTGAVVNNAVLQLDFANDAVFASTLTGAGALVKTGGGVASMSGAGSMQGSVAVNAGALRFLQNGTFATSGDYTTAVGATTGLSTQSQLAVGGAFTMNGTLNNVAGESTPVIDAKTATIGPGAAFNIAGYTASVTASATQLASNVFTEIHTTAPGGLNGRFATTRIGGSANPVDYLTLTSAYTPQDFIVGLGLTWYASHGATPQTANGVFTLTDTADTFDMDAVLIDQPANSATGWDGKTLTKAGAGTLTLSKANAYTGATLVDGGTLQAGARNVIANSAQLAIAAGATFDLNGFDQQANNLAGAGSVTLGGASLTANNNADSTFAGVIGGSGSVSKTGAGTLTLTGDNTFSGPTTITASTLQLGAGGASGSVAGDIVDNGALAFDRSDRVTYAHTISGTGNLVQAGSGSLLLSGAQTYSGTTAVNAGALLLTNGAQLANTSRVTVANGATFGGYGAVGGSVLNNGVLAVADAAPGFASGPAGQFVIGGALINNGAIRMSSPAPASTLTVMGNYTGNNGQLWLSTVLGGDDSATDRLIVRGDSTGSTSVKIANAGGTGGATSNGIRIVEVDGQSNGVFSLDGRAVAGPYEYGLFKGGVSTPDDGDWYLRSSSNSPSPTPRPEPGGYLANQSAARDMFIMTLHDRAGFTDPYAANGMTGNESTVWARTRGAHTDGNAAGGRIAESADTAMVQAGIDLLHRVSNGSRWQAGVMAGYGATTTDATASNNPATARGNVNGASAGVYATWHRNPMTPDGPYVDTWFQYAHFDNTVKGAQLNGENYASRVWAGSVEGGWAIALGQTSTGPVLIEPQAQVIWSNYGADDHIESNGTVVHADTVNSVTTRLGVRLFHAPGSEAAPGWLPFIELNWWHDTSGNSIAFNDIVVSQDGPRNRMEVKVGAQGQIARQWRVWGNLGYQQGDGGYRSFQGLLGARYIW